LTNTILGMTGKHEVCRHHHKSTDIFYDVYQIYIFLLHSASEHNRSLVAMYSMAVCIHRSIPMVQGGEHLATTMRLMPCREFGSVMDVRGSQVNLRNEASEGLSPGLFVVYKCE
jgi:hypothetical protein